MVRVVRSSLPAPAARIVPSATLRPPGTATMRAVAGATAASSTSTALALSGTPHELASMAKLCGVPGSSGSPVRASTTEQREIGKYAGAADAATAGRGVASGKGTRRSEERRGGEEG